MSEQYRVQFKYDLTRPWCDMGVAFDLDDALCVVRTLAREGMVVRIGKEGEL